MPALPLVMALKGIKGEGGYELFPSITEEAEAKLAMKLDEMVSSENTYLTPI